MFGFSKTAVKVKLSLTDGTRQDNINFNCAPMVANGIVYVGSGDGKLYTYYLPD